MKVINEIYRHEDDLAYEIQFTAHVEHGIFQCSVIRGVILAV